MSPDVRRRPAEVQEVVRDDGGGESWDEKTYRTVLAKNLMREHKTSCWHASRADGGGARRLVVWGRDCTPPFPLGGSRYEHTTQLASLA